MNMTQEEYDLSIVLLHHYEKVLGRKLRCNYFMMVCIAMYSIFMRKPIITIKHYWLLFTK